MASAARISQLLKRHYGTPRHPRGKPLDVFIETILSQNTNDKNSSRAFSRLKAKFPSWEKVSTASVKSIESAIRVGGLPNIKAKRIKNALKEIRRRERKLSIDSLRAMPTGEAFAYLTSFDGVGPKTAAVVLAFSFGRSLIPADTHVHRVANRLGLAQAASPAKTQEKLERLVPDRHKHSLHLNLIRHGREVCRSKIPRCSSCFLSGLCPRRGVLRA